MNGERKTPDDGVHDWSNLEAKARFAEYLLDYCVNNPLLAETESEGSKVFPRKSGTP